MIEFKGFPKMARLSRECIITEKIDGTNAQICITEDGQFLSGVAPAGLRQRMITSALPSGRTNTRKNCWRLA